MNFQCILIEYNVIVGVKNSFEVCWELGYGILLIGSDNRQC